MGHRRSPRSRWVALGSALVGSVLLLAGETRLDLAAAPPADRLGAAT